jgi:hypothetical protein
MAHNIYEVKSMRFVFPNAPEHEASKDDPEILGEDGVELHITFEDSFSKLESCVVFKSPDARPIYDQVKELLKKQEPAEECAASKS